MRFFAAPLLFIIFVYQRFISPLFPPSCRYAPTCSAYAKEAILLHGPFRGGLMGAKRILRCHPFVEGGVDPVPGSEMHMQARKAGLLPGCKDHEHK